MVHIDIQATAALARLSLSADELETLQGEVESILGFVEEVQTITTDTLVPKSGILRNVLREDVVLNEAGSYTESLISAAPRRNGDFVAVKQVLSGGKHAVDNPH